MKLFARRLTWAIVCLFLLVSAACADSDNGSAEDEGSAEGSGEVESQNLVFAAGAQGAAYFVVSTAMSQVLQDEPPNHSVSVQATAGSSQNAQLVHEGQADLGIAGADVVFLAVHGEDPFEEPLSLKVMMGTHVTVLSLVTLSDSGIEQMTDIEGKRIHTGASGSAGAVLFPIYAEAAGVAPDSYEQVFMDYTEAVAALREGVIDASLQVTKPLSPGFQELVEATDGDIHIVPIEQDVMDIVLEERPFYTVGTATAEETGLDQDTTGFGIPGAIFVNENADDDLVESMTRTIFENTDVLAEITPLGAEYNLENFATGVNVPFHPGAAAFYKEAGVWEDCDNCEE